MAAALFKVFCVLFSFSLVLKAVFKNFSRMEPKWFPVGKTMLTPVLKGARVMDFY